MYDRRQLTLMGRRRYLSPLTTMVTPARAASQPSDTAEIEEHPTSGRGFLRGPVALTRAAVVLLGVLQLWVYRYDNNNDGMHYLDIAAQYARGDFAGAVNAFWSPLYSWLFIPIQLVFNVGPAHEFEAAHVLNLVLFVAALAAFEFLLRQLFATVIDSGRPGAASFRLAWWIAGYSCFAYSILVMVNLGRVGPDIVVAASVFASSALLLKASRQRGASVGHGALLGAVLGLGYLGKAALFPISIAVILVLAVLLRRRARGWLSVAMCAGVFLGISLPWVAVLSTQKDRLTFGDAGRLNYAWKVNNVPVSHWQGDTLTGRPLHPTRTLSRGPTVYEFAEPIRGTYPVWHDPSYWFEGIHPRFVPRTQLARLMSSVDYFITQPWFAPMLLATLVASLIAGKAAAASVVRRMWFVLVPSAVGLLGYAVVLVFDRYIAPFVVATFLTLMAGLLQEVGGTRNGNPRIPAALLWGVAFVFGIMTLESLWFVDRLAPRENRHLATANQIRSLGVPDGSRIGVIGNGPHSYWAELSGNRVVAEIMPAEVALYWSLSAGERRRLLDLFRRPGAVAVVADNVPGWADVSGWKRAPDGYWVYMLPTAGNAVGRPTP
jgi:hypothetical protein